MSHSILIDEPPVKRPRLEALPKTAAAHFKLWLMGAVLHVAEQLAGEQALAEFPFLQSYLDEIEDLGGGTALPAAGWAEAVNRWESDADGALPLRALAARAGLDAGALTLLLTVGLLEEDPRFGGLFEWAQPGLPGQQRPTLGLLTAWWRQDHDCSRVRNDIRRLRELGLIDVVNPEAPRIQWAFQAEPLLWDVLRGEGLAPLPWLDYGHPEMLPDLGALVLPAGLKSKLEGIPALLLREEARAVVVRGPLHNGRKALLRGIARRMGYGTLEVRGAVKPEDPRWRCLGALAMALRAMPVFTFELGPGDAAPAPELAGYGGPVGIALSRHGNVTGSLTECALTVELPLPDAAARRKLWSQSLRAARETAPDWAGRFRLTSGGILRSAAMARAQAGLEGRTAVEREDVQHANRALRHPLENLATRLTVCGGWEQMVGCADTLAELRMLENRCRYREELPGALAPGLAASVNHGVRALFSGASGTGKTLAAKLLASELEMDIYRVDLSAVVNKYVGETEKNLNQIFARAEELDVILLIDEGDALLTNRTAVQSSNDRYANLETNFLLQRIESFEGIVVITTNAGERIDSAFQRRMDIVIDFRLPDAGERWSLWRLHLPPGHAVEDAWLEEVSQRCNLTGGQIRNAALHAALLALERGGTASTADAEQAVQREYRKLGAVCPLRRPAYRR